MKKRNGEPMFRISKNEKYFGKSELILMMCIAFFSTTVAYADLEKKNGEGIYNEYCAGCHDGGFKGWMTGAPTLGDYKEWKSFFETGIDKMTHNVITGEKKHEKKGDCEKCSDDDIRNSISHIIAKTKNK